jgi:hypothetical protein
MVSMTPEQRKRMQHYVSVAQRPVSAEPPRGAINGQAQADFEAVSVPDDWQGAYYCPRTPQDQAERQPWIAATRAALQASIRRER